MTSFPFPARGHGEVSVWEHRTSAHQPDCFLHGQPMAGNCAGETRCFLGWGSGGVNAAQPALPTKLPGAAEITRAQMLTRRHAQILLFCRHLTPECSLRRDRALPCRRPPALRTPLAAFVVLERRERSLDTGGGEARPWKHVLGMVPCSLLSLVIFIQGSNAHLQ